MDIKQKLEFYKSTGKSQSPASQINILPSLTALSDHFNGHILHPSAPYLDITRSESLRNHNGAPINIRLLSKNNLTDPVPIEEVIFFDLETTGLAGGTGTFAFLLGFGWVEGNEIIIKQYFLPDFGREYKLFEELNQLFSKFKYLVSYNGKSYDSPLLRSRFLLNRQSFQLEKLYHIDLLHMARRVWKDSFSSCDLKTLENGLLGVEREGDIPGAFIPQAYFDFIRTGVIHDIIRIITHNYIDITSLAGLLFHLSAIESRPRNLNDPAAQLRMARLAFELDEPELLDHLGDLFEGGSNQALQIKKWKSLLYKRKRRWPDALDLWNDLTVSSAHQLFALEELAKFYEHVESDFRKAIEYSQRAITILNMMEEFRDNKEILSYKQAFNHRYCRLIQKTA